MPVSNYIPSTSTHPKEETVLLPFGNKKPSLKIPLRNIAYIGIILVFAIPSIYYISEQVLLSQPNENLELQIVEDPLGDEVNPSLDELQEIEELLILVEKPAKEINQSNKYALWEFSGPFGINKVIYKMDDRIQFIGVNIPKEDTGKIVFKRPNGEEFKEIDYDGSLDKFYKFEFIPKFTDIKKCRDCVKGYWQIYINSDTGNSYRLIRFLVQD